MMDHSRETWMALLVPSDASPSFHLPIGVRLSQLVGLALTEETLQLSQIYWHKCRKATPQQPERWQRFSLYPNNCKYYQTWRFNWLLLEAWYLRIQYILFSLGFIWFSRLLLALSDFHLTLQFIASFHLTRGNRNPISHVSGSWGATCHSKCADGWWHEK